MREPCWNFVNQFYFLLFQIIKTPKANAHIPRSLRRLRPRRYPEHFISKTRRSEADEEEHVQKCYSSSYGLRGKQNHPGDAFSQHLCPPAVFFMTTCMCVYLEVLGSTSYTSGSDSGTRKSFSHKPVTGFTLLLFVLRVGERQ
jgi:hypothetical protein